MPVEMEICQLPAEVYSILMSKSLKFAKNTQGLEMFDMLTQGCLFLVLLFYDVKHLFLLLGFIWKAKYFIGIRYIESVIREDIGKGKERCLNKCSSLLLKEEFRITYSENI